MVALFNRDNGGSKLDSFSLPLPPALKALATAAVLLLVGAFVLLPMELAGYRNTDTALITLATGLFFTLLLVGLAGCLFGLIWLIQLLTESNKRRESYTTLLSQSMRSSAAPSEVLTQDLERMQTQMDQAVRMLQEINENTLLDETGRRHKYEYMAHQERRRTFTEVDKLIQDHEWAQAKALLDGLGQKFPGNSDVQGYLYQMEELRKQAFNEELTQSRKKIQDFIAISAWDKAIRQAELLQEKHPDMPAAKELQLYVRAERNRFREEQIKKMYADIQRSTGRKRWNDALQVAKQLVDKYPDSVEAEALRGQMPTLESNAEIEKRQELEEQIKDMVRRRNFIQAVELARFVLENYPTSPQASALRNQIDRLEELARQQEKEVQL